MCICTSLSVCVGMSICVGESVCVGVCERRECMCICV